MRTVDNIEFVGEIDIDTSLQRYIDFSKFVALLETSELFLAKASSFEDPLEGSLTPINSLVANGTAQLLSEVVESLPRAERQVEHPKSDKRGKKSLYEDRKYSTVFGEVPHTESTFEHVIKQQREWVDVCCWHANMNESIAMWKIYGGLSNAVCVVTDVKSLCKSLRADNCLRLVLSKITYISHSEDHFVVDHPLAPLMHKAHFYNFENEVRLMCYKPDAPFLDMRNRDEHGTNISVDLRELIKEIRVDVRAPDWFYNLVCNLVMRYQLSAKVKRSDLPQQPIYDYW